MTSPYTFLCDFWPHDFTAADLIAYRSSPDRMDGYLEAVQARMTVLDRLLEKAKEVPSHG